MSAQLLPFTGSKRVAHFIARHPKTSKSQVLSVMELADRFEIQVLSERSIHPAILSMYFKEGGKQYHCAAQSALDEWECRKEASLSKGLQSMTDWHCPVLRKQLEQWLAQESR